jgi:hypothetical protein
VPASEQPSVVVDAGAPTVARLELSVRGAESGSVLIDELYLSDPAVELDAEASARATLAVPGPIVVVGDTPVLSDVSITQDLSSTLQGAGSGAAAVALRSLTSVSAVLLGADAEADLGVAGAGAVADQGLQTQLRAGHRLRVPFRGGRITLTDELSEYRADDGVVFGRENALGVSIPGALNAEATVSAGLDSPFLRQAWEGTLCSALNVPFSAEAELSLQESRIAPTLSPAWYGASWVEGYRLIVVRPPTEDTARTADASLALALTTEPVGFRAGVSLLLRSNGLPQLRRIDGASATVSFPIHVAGARADALMITTQAARSIRVETPLTGTSSIGDELAASLTSLASRRVLAAAPIADIWSEPVFERFAGDTATANAAEFVPSYSVRLQRKTGPHLRDLFLPNDVLLAVERALSRERDSLQDTATARIEGGGSARNLFGRLGRYPLTEAYRTDEFASSVQVRMESDRTAEERTVHAIGETRAEFVTDRSGTLAFEQRLSLAWEPTFLWESSTHASLTHRADGPRAVTVPLVGLRIGRGVYWEHREVVGFTAAAENSQLKATLEHETRLVLGNRGHLSGSLAVGGLRRTVTDVPDGLLYQLGVEAALELMLSF